MNTGKAQLIKRIFDLFLSILIILVLFIPSLFILVILTFYFKENPVFAQQRVGKNSKLFTLYKLRTLKGNLPKSLTNEASTLGSLPRFLLKYKINEIPQLINILAGDMSFVGPRPDVPGFADELAGEDRIILEVKPGLTGPATLKYRNEIELLSMQEDPEHYNKTVIWPDKVKINKAYISNWSFLADLKIILRTIFDT